MSRKALLVGKLVGTIQRTALIGGFVCGAATGCSRRDPGPPPSILLVTFDTLRADHVGCYGRSEAETPNLDQLARDGLRFDDARSHVPLTLPSHATILTGLLPPRHGVRGNGLFRLGPETPALAALLREHGYATAAIVSSVVLDRAYGLARGFDTYDDNQRVGDKAAFRYLERGASQVAESAAAILPRLSPPYFLWVHFFDPHRPWVAPDAFARRHPGRGYDAEIAFADAAFGEIRQAATRAAAGRANLVVVATADHGESLGEHGENQHGYTLHRGVLRVPLIIAGPNIPAGRVVPEAVGLVDLAPTLAEIARANLAAVDGASLVPAWSESGTIREVSTANPLWEETLHPLFDSRWAPLRGLLTSDWHFVDAPRPELYARRDDPGDRTDVAATNAESVRDLRTRLASLASELGDVPEPAPQVGDETDDRDLLEKLASLGYLSSGADEKPAGARLDPKDGLPGFIAVEDAERLFAEGRFRDAYERVRPFTRVDPENPRLWHAQGKALLALRRTREAEAALARALRLDPRSEFIRYTYVDLLRAKGDLAGAREQLQAILATNPRSVEATLELADALARARDFGQAEAVLLAGHDAGVRDPDLLVGLGVLLERRGARDEATARFVEALALRPNDATALYEAGRAALRAENPARAIELLGRCTEGPRAFECRIELARALVVGPRDLAAARALLEGARALAASDVLRKEVDRRLAALDQMGAAGSPHGAR